MTRAAPLRDTDGFSNKFPAVAGVAVVRLDSPHGGDKVASDAARNTAGDVKVSPFRSPGIQTSSVLYCAAVPLTDDMVR